MRRKRFDPKARGIVCAVKRANVIGAMDQRTTSGPAGRQDQHRQAEDMTAPTIKRTPAKNPLISGRRPDMSMPPVDMVFPSRWSRDGMEAANRGPLRAQAFFA